ncbi:MAG: potassium/proton antiporter [Bacteroidetes bacterium]|nr:potassium/proton antiporter [Bacteroidota bacterium]
MDLTTDNILLIGSLLLFLSIIVSKTTGRFGIPALILFLGIGMLAGSEGLGRIHFDDPLIAQFLGTVALTFILFSGGLDTQWKQVKPHFVKGLVLSTLGVVLTATSVGVFVYYVTDFTLIEGMLLGSIVASTDAAAVFSLLRAKNVKLKGSLKPILELESGSNDPMAFYLTIGFTFILVNPDTTLASMIPLFFRQMILGAVIGIAMGKIMCWIMNKIKLDYEGLYPVLILSLIFIAYSGSTFIGGNGYQAVYLSGLILGKQSFLHKNSLTKFYDGQAWLMQIVMFLTLGLLVYPSHILPIIPLGLLVSFFLIFVSRPLAVFLSLPFFKMENKERLFVSWVGLKGAVPIVFATYPLIIGIEKSEMIFNLVFFIVLVSIILQGTSIPLVAKWLKVLEEGKIEKPKLSEEEYDAFNKGLLKLEIPKGAKSINKKIVELDFPSSSLIIMIDRKNEFIPPKGSTELKEGDNLMILIKEDDDIDKIKKSLGLN